MIKFQMMLGAVLFALILTMASDLVSDAIIPTGGHVAEAPHGKAAPQTAAAPGQPAPAGAPQQPIGELVAAADPAAGQQASSKCKACHTFEPGGPNRVGPNLAGVVGADIAAKPDFAYSDALKGKPGNWTDEALDHFIAKPGAFAQGTKMTFAGVADAKERAAIIAYLRSLSPNAPPPGGEQAAAPK